MSNSISIVDRHCRGLRRSAVDDQSVRATVRKAKIFSTKNNSIFSELENFSIATAMNSFIV